MMVGAYAERLFNILYSKEGVTQGDLLFMFMYAVGTLSLICLLCNPGQWM